MSSSSPSLSKAPRRVPPPCWTHDETLALIDSYHHRWHSLGRGNLKASHWQQVADSLAARSPLPPPAPPKTATQCRHKIEKLRKRYRSEKQRASASALPNRFFSSWNFFKKMDALERGPPPPSSLNPDSDDDDNNQEDDDNNDEDPDDDDENDNIIKCRINSSPSNFGGGFKFRVPVGSGSGSTMRPPLSKHNNFNNNGGYDEFDGSLAHRYNPNSTPNPRPLPNSTSRPPPFTNGLKREMDPDPMAEMISSIRMLGEGYVRMEERKLEMEREMEQMRMEMEMKRTQMILESQQRIVEAFASGVSPGNKKMKRMPPSPES